MDGWMPIDFRLAAIDVEPGALCRPILKPAQNPSAPSCVKVPRMTVYKREPELLIRKRAAIALLKKSLSREWFTRIRMLYALGYWPNLAEPRTFNEMLARRRVRREHRRYGNLQNKLEAREFARNRVGEKYLSESYGLISSVGELDLDMLPEWFVAKAVSIENSRGIYIVPRKADLDVKHFRQSLDRFIHYHGRHDPRQVFFEELLVDPGFEVPRDYKCWTFHGRVEAIGVISNRFDGRSTQNFYTRDWQDIPMARIYPRDPEARIPRPGNLDEIVRVAEALAEGIDFVRVDLYSLNDRRVVFGEMTLNPAAGVGAFTPREYDYEFGRL